MTAITPSFSQNTAAATPVSVARSGDILGAVMVMGKDDARIGSAIGIGFASLLHGYVVVRVLLALIAMASWVREARNEMHSFFWATQQVEAAKEAEKEKPGMWKRVST